jgi:hypothetical protein
MLANNVPGEELPLEVRACEAVSLPRSCLDVVWLEVGSSRHAANDAVAACR